MSARPTESSSRTDTDGGQAAFLPLAGGAATTLIIGSSWVPSITRAPGRYLETVARYEALGLLPTVLVVVLLFAGIRLAGLRLMTATVIEIVLSIAVGAVLGAVSGGTGVGMLAIGLPTIFVLAGALIGSVVLRNHHRLAVVAVAAALAVAVAGTTAIASGL